VLRILEAPGFAILDAPRPLSGRLAGVVLRRLRFQSSRSFRMAYSAHPTRAREVPVAVNSRLRTAAFKVDQTLPLPAGQPFRPIGRCQLDGDVETTIAVSNSGTDGFVILDAIQLLPVDTGKRSGAR